MGAGDLFGELGGDLFVELDDRDVGDGHLAHRSHGGSELVAPDAVVAEQQRDELQQVAVGGRRHGVERLLRQVSAGDQRLTDGVALVGRLALGHRGGSASAVAVPPPGGAMSSGRGFRSAMVMLSISELGGGLRLERRGWGQRG